MEPLYRSPRHLSMEDHIRRLEKFKMVSNGNVSNKIPFSDVCRDINLVGT